MINIDQIKYLKDLKEFKIYINKNDKGISKTLKKYKFKTKWPREPEFMYLFHKKIKEDSNIIDLGANIGYLTLYFKKVLKVKNKILSVEPESLNFSFLTENIKLNNLQNEVVCKNLALADVDDYKYFQLSSHSNLHKISSEPSEDKISCKKLSTLLLEEDFEPDFIKMDVEGAEIEIIEGFQKYIREKKPKLSILFEVHPNEYNQNRSFDNQLKFLFTEGFRVESLITAGTNYPIFFENKGYKPEISFKSGKFNRFIINNVSETDVIDALNNQVFYPEKKNYIDILRTFSIKSYSKKIVRGLLLTRG